MEFEETRLCEDLWLRKVGEDALDFVFSEYPDDLLKSFLGIDSEEALEAERKKYHKGYSTFNKGFLFFHLLLGNEKKNIGWCGFHTWYFDHDRAEIGYSIFEAQYRNKGYMSKAFQHAIDYGFQAMNLNRIEAFVASYNEPSLRLLHNAGFAREGTLKQHYFTNGRHEDSLLYALLRENYSPAES